MSPLAIARQSNAMAKESGSPAFQNAAMVMMGVMAAASAAHVIHLLWNDLNRHERQHNHGRGR